MKIHITTTLDVSLKKLCNDNNISFKDCLDLGARIRLAELDLIDYPETKRSISLLNIIKNLEDRLQ